MGRHVRQLDVFNRVAKWPMANVVQQRGSDEPLCIIGGHGRRKACVVRELLEVQQSQPIHAQRMLEPSVVGCRVNQRDQTELADLGQPSELGSVNDGADARCERHIQFGRNPYQASACIETADFRYVADMCSHLVSKSERPQSNTEVC